jgi:protein-tyrosine-phosphatase
MTRRVLGIYREAEHSPGMAAADKAILDAVLERLAEMGFSVVKLAPARVGEVEPRAFDLVLAMCKNHHTLQQLAVFEREGVPVVNSTLAIRNCCRDLVDAGLSRQGVPIPRGKLVRTVAATDWHQVAELGLERGVFVKPADPEALASYAVTKVQEITALRQVLSTLAEKGVRQAYVQQAVQGTEVKFYGVARGLYFATVPDLSEAAPTQGRALAIAAAQAAQILGLEVWGGDAVIAGAGFWIIDFNAWPSFAPVREAAARAIARRCAALVEHGKHRLADAKNIG